MTDEIEQLLRNLHLKQIAAIVDDELAHAEQQELSYSAFLARLLRAQYHHRQETALAWRIKLIFNSFKSEVLWLEALTAAD